MSAPIRPEHREEANRFLDADRQYTSPRHDLAQLLADTEAAKDAEIAALSAEYADAVRALAGLDDYFDQRADADAVGDPQRYVGNTEMHRLADIRRITSTPRARAVLEQGETT